MQINQSAVIKARHVTAFMSAASFLQTTIALSHTRTRNSLYGLKNCGTPRDENRLRTSQKRPEGNIETSERRRNRRTNKLRNNRFTVCLTKYMYIYTASVVQRQRSTQVCGFKPGRSIRIFGRKNPEHAFLRRRSKAVGPMSQICGIKKIAKFRWKSEFRQNYYRTSFSPTVSPLAARITRVFEDGGTWRLKWERLKAGEGNGKLPSRTCPVCSVPEPYRSHDWALVPAKPAAFKAEY